MIIMKFGGASLKNGSSILHVANVVRRFKNKKVVVVVSAMYKVTDSLILLYRMHQSGESQQAFKELIVIGSLHKQALQDLELSGQNSIQSRRVFEDLLKHLKSYLRKTKFSPSDYDYIVSFGERFASVLMAAALNKVGVKAKSVNGSEVIIASDNFSNGRALIRETRLQAKKSLNPLFLAKTVPVVTGFFASTKNGEVVTLGRGGSDYSATILANVLNANEVILWKEVDGVFSSDPKQDENAKFYTELSYEVALSLAQKGAKVLHPEAMKPVASKGIVVWVKNTFKPDFDGTKIWKGVTA